MSENEELEVRSSLGHLPAKPRWEFDASVVRCFEDMLQRSIPDYTTMRQCCFDIAKGFLRPHSLVFDLGSSQGDGIADLLTHATKAGHQAVMFYALDSSPEMTRVCQDRFRHDDRVLAVQSDLRTETVLRAADGQASLVQAILTLQFIPVEHRQRVVRNVYQALRPGGAFVVVEKVLGGDADLNDYLVDRYYTMKERNGYTRAEIATKRLALEGVLVPLKAAWNEEMLRDEGFRVERIWQCLNFVGWVAIK